MSSDHAGTPKKRPSHRMPDLNPEQVAHRNIDDQLVAAGWEVHHFHSVNFSAGRAIALREAPLTTGPCDYFLLVDRRALGGNDAKKVGTTLSTVADQSARHANSLSRFLATGFTGTLPFLYESTGIETFFRDERDPTRRSRRVVAVHHPETLAEWAAEPDSLRTRPKALPSAHPPAIAGMRGCQIEAITGLEHSCAQDRPRTHIHLSTGAGKTFTACAFTYRLIKYAKARRVLFHFDRANLGEQARDNFYRYSLAEYNHAYAVTNAENAGSNVYRIKTKVLEADRKVDKSLLGNYRHAPSPTFATSGSASIFGRCQASHNSSWAKYQNLA